MNCNYNGNEISCSEFISLQDCMKCNKGKVNDTVNHPSHYNYAKMEVIEVIDAFDCNFEQGNIIKYVLRYKHKNGLEDLSKAMWYLQHLIEKEEKLLFSEKSNV